jgi:multisubunit Na+/H+ antiporter MnhF subunit
LLLSEGFKRSIYTNVALALAVAGPLATLALARFLERDA